MVYTLLDIFGSNSSIFHALSPISVRTGGAMISGLMLSLLFGKACIRILQSVQVGATNVRQHTPDNHLNKIGTPSMGGILILFSVIVPTLIWAKLDNIFVWICIIVLMGYGLIGFVDDWKKISKKNSKGISGKSKLFWQTGIAIIAISIYQYAITPDLTNTVSIPFTKNLLVDLGIFFIPFATVVIIGASNAVNLTDGLDGLATWTTLIAIASFGSIAYLVGHSVYANFLHIPHITGVGEIVIVAGALVGACLGFLWFNTSPAQIFMGDTGSLALGGVLGTFAVITKHEITLIIIGGIFVAETLSVIIQVVSFKLTGKRVFAMAPLHHHYEKKGLAETTIVSRFLIIALLLAIIGLSTLKFR